MALTATGRLATVRPHTPPGSAAGEGYVVTWTDAAGGVHCRYEHPESLLRTFEARDDAARAAFVLFRRRQDAVDDALRRFRPGVLGVDPLTVGRRPSGAAFVLAGGGAVALRPGVLAPTRNPDTFVLVLADVPGRFGWRLIDAADVERECAKAVGDGVAAAAARRAATRAGRPLLAPFGVLPSEIVAAYGEVP